ncbi:MAG: response regulator transcription factor [candidate division Zixibacteria bacterium]|jgi:two-component system response regulator NreC|nr:response regulator transcription factor [candidate division Zixibacteria bacterium]
MNKTKPKNSIKREESMGKIRLLVADDHKIFRQGIKKLLEEEKDLQVVGEAKDGREAVKKAEELKPDIVLMDVAMADLNGMEATRQIKKALPDTKILMLTMHKNEEYVLQSFQAGACAYVLKEGAVEELVSAIHSVYNDKSYLSPTISKTVVDAYLRKMETGKMETPFDLLTDREREVLQLIAEGYTNREVAKSLYISVKTVEAHRAHIMQKLDIHEVARLVKYAIQKGLVDLTT